MVDGHGSRFVVPVQGGHSGRGAPPEGGSHRATGEGRFQLLFEHAPLGVALSDLDGRFTEVNRTLRDLLDGTGVDPDRGRLADLARHLPTGSDEARAWWEGLADVLAGRSPVARAELPIAAPDAAPRWLQATTAVIVLGRRRYLLSHFEDTTGRRLAEQRLARLALHDGLTGLANATLLAERLAEALAGGGCVASGTGVLYLDLDGFTRVNDTLGHDGGDGVLVAVANRLTRLLRAGDTAGRLGGDTFCVIAQNVPDDAALGDLARRIDREIAEPLDLDRARLRVGASVGAVLARPGDTLAAAVGRAERAMAAVKRARRATVDLRAADVGASDPRLTDLRLTDLRLTDDLDVERPA